MTTRRRILIVDDESRVAFFLQESLEALGHNFDVVGVSSTKQALEEVGRAEFDLLVTDQRMPGMNGLDLIRQVQKLCPDTQSILITAYDTDDTYAQAQQVGALRYFTKPFHIEDFIQTVLDALQKDTHGWLEPLLNRQTGVLGSRLEELRREVGAQCVLASDIDGAPVAQAGVLAGLDVDPLLQLAADGFAASSEMAYYLGGNHTANLAYYEGDSHDIYVVKVHDDLFLVIVFDRRIQASRIGIVWLYARRAIENLRRVRLPDLVGAGLD